MIERCEVELEPGTRCVLPAGHPGDDHEYDAALPEDIARYLAEYMERLELATEGMHRARREYEKAHRSSKISFWVFLVVALVYVGLIVWQAYF